MIRHAIIKLGIVKSSSNLYPYKTQINASRRSLSTFRQSLVAYSTKVPSIANLNEQIKNWEQTLDDTSRQRLFEIKVELKLKYENGENVCNPEQVTLKQWEQFLALRSVAARRREYEFLSKKNFRRAGKNERKEQRLIRGAVIKENVLKERIENKHINYGLNHTALISRIKPSTINTYYNMRLVRAKQFGHPKVIFDFSYDSYMGSTFIRYTAKNLTLAYACNRINLHPFDLHICNSKSGSRTMQELDRIIPTLHEPKFTMDVHSECCTKLSAKENLVYMTPYSKNFLTEYNGSDNFVIPAMVDKGYDGPISLARAKELGIRTAWFPFDRYLLRNGLKYLPLDIIVSILLDFKSERTWNQAFKNIPDYLLSGSRRSRQELSDALRNKSNAEHLLESKMKMEDSKRNSLKSVRNPFEF